MVDQVEEQILFSTFNQDASCFAVGTETGFRIYNSYPFKDNYERGLNGGIGIIEMLNRCNVVALVGGGKNPKFAPNKVIIWDDHQSKVISELRFISYVKNIKLKRDKIFVVCESKIFVFTFVTFEAIDTIDTYDNPRGIIAVAPDSKVSIIAFLGKTVGTVMVKNYETQNIVTINAHKKPVSFMSLNHDGTILATVSDKGTLIRVFNTKDGSLLKELKRGKEKAEIYSVAFDNSSKLLACSSNKKTVHVFSLANNTVDEADKQKEQSDEPKNHKGVMGKISGFFGSKSAYFTAESSFAQFRIADPQSICAFGPDSSIIVVSSNGKYYQACFDPKLGGECTKIQEKDMF